MRSLEETTIAKSTLRHWNVIRVGTELEELEDERWQRFITRIRNSRRCRVVLKVTPLDRPKRLEQQLWAITEYREVGVMEGSEVNPQEALRIDYPSTLRMEEEEEVPTATRKNTPLLLPTLRTYLQSQIIDSPVSLTILISILPLNQTVIDQPLPLSNCDHARHPLPLTTTYQLHTADQTPSHTDSLRLVSLFPFTFELNLTDLDLVSKRSREVAEMILRLLHLPLQVLLEAIPPNQFRQHRLISCTILIPTGRLPRAITRFLNSTASSYSDQHSIVPRVPRVSSLRLNGLARRSRTLIRRARVGWRVKRTCRRRSYVICESPFLNFLLSFSS